MAEIAASPQKAGVRKLRRLSTRVDLTPMVDLGFLLITFFIFTTTMSASNAMNVVMPNDQPTKDPAKYQDVKTLTFVLGSNDRLFYYQGIFKNILLSTDYRSGLRKVVSEKKNWLATHNMNRDDLLVLIKPAEGSSFRNVVNLLDEMLVNDVHRYMIVDLTEAEQRIESHLRQ